MCSGNGTNFENIVENCPDHEVVVMIYNIKGCGAQERAERLGIPNCRIKSIDEQKIIDKLISFIPHPSYFLYIVKI